jgi:DNA-binding beta-propeller fold protein YncE
MAAFSMGSLAAIAYLPGGTSFVVARIVILIAAVALIGFSVRPLGRRAVPLILVAAVIGSLSLFSVHTMIMASFVRGDVPKDMLVYTQSGPDIPRIRSEIDALAAATGKGYDLPIAVDSADSFAWPWAWYLRDYKAVGYLDFSSKVPDGVANGDYAVILVNASNLSRLNDALSTSPTRYGEARRYPHRWWFPEDYKDAMETTPGQPCITKSGNCGPFRLATWETIADGIFHHHWLDTWFSYWRDHDPDEITGAAGGRRCNSCGSVDAYAYFPANFDPSTGTLSAKPIEPSKPTVDRAGRPTFGGIGALPGQFFAPVDVESDRDGNLYVIDSKSHRLQKFDQNGNFLAGVDVRLDPQNPNETSSPWGLAIAPNGDVVVADTFAFTSYGRIRVFDRDLKPTGVMFGQPIADPSKAPGPYELYGPRDVAVDRSGNIWVTDTGNARLMVYSATGEYLRTVGSRGSGPGQFDEPVGIAIDASGDIYVADMYNHRVEILDSTGAYRSAVQVDGWGGQDARDKPYLRPLSNGRIALSLPSLNQARIYDRSGGVVTTINPTDEPLSTPYGIVETADGKLWISEGGSGRLRLFAVP